MRRIALLSLVFGGLSLLLQSICLADGGFVFRWNKQIDINEPTQKAIILYDQGREDLVLQVKYEGPAEEFGWLVPVPGLPKVSKGSMDCFYELSRLTQQRAARYEMFGHGEERVDSSVNVIKVETVGAYEVAVLSAGDAAKLTEWLEANGFVFPKEKQEVLGGYIKKGWYFVVARIDPNRNGFIVRQGSPKMAVDKKAISASTRQKLASGELHPLVISFGSEKCVFPLAISSINGKPSEVSLYVLSGEPLMSRTIFDKEFAAYSKARKEWLQKEPELRKARSEQLKEMDKAQDERIAAFRSQLATNSSIANRFQYDDPNDPRPPQSIMRKLMRTGPRFSIDELDRDYPGNLKPLLLGMEADSKDLAACAKELPRLGGKSWWLTKQVHVFAPEEMQDLDFEPAVPFLAGLLRAPDGLGQGYLCLRQFGELAVPAVLAGMKSSDPEERRLACSAASEIKDSRFGPASVSLLGDENARTRAAACYAIENNWNDDFAPRLAERLSDPSEEVRQAAGFILKRHPNESLLPTYRKLLEEDTVAGGQAILLTGIEGYSRRELIHFFSSTNLPVVAVAFNQLRYSLAVDEVAPLLTNSLPMARLMGLGELAQMSSKPAIDRMIAMLRDPNEIVRWRVRSGLREITGQKLGADPAAYEQWWKENRETFTPPPPGEGRRLRQSRFAAGQ